MAPAADMFEMGIEVQVLRRGTLFAQRGKRLYELYRSTTASRRCPAEVRQKLEREVFRASVDEIWQECERFWTAREVAQVERARREPHHRMALVFRWYLGNSNRWAREGVADRMQDYQIWCGPAIGAFNAWAAGTELADPSARTVTAIGLNLLAGAVRLTRAQHLRAAGLTVPDGALGHPLLAVESYA
jgi:trans-AT polyketide synthase, acyltransferase and oxidoreductase domains